MPVTVTVPVPKPQRLILGPQRPITNLGEVFAKATLPEGPVAVITAGWQEAEGDLDEIQRQLERPLIDMQLYQRAEHVFFAEKILSSAYRERQDKLLELQRLYRMRLRNLVRAVQQLRREKTHLDLVVAEERHAIAQLRALDRHHLDRISTVYAEYEDTISSSDMLAEQTALIEDSIKDCQTVLISGGNVLVLLNRLQLFGVRHLLADRHLIAWSAGAMVLSDQVVLYHDKTPLGRREPEILGAGLGLLPGYVFLPDAKKRLRPKDTVRTGLYNKRFAPARCVTLDSGTSLCFAGDRIVSAKHAAYLTAEGVHAGISAV